MNDYATVSDITSLGVTLTAQQQETAGILLKTASSKLRVIARRHGSDLDEMAADPDFSAALKNTVVQAVIRAMGSISDTSPAVSQATQTALGYSVSATWVNPGQSLYFLRNELKELGIFRQKAGVLEVYGNAADDSGN